jgi:hypothetical protein
MTWQYQHVGWYLRNSKQAFALARRGVPFNFGPWPKTEVKSLEQWQRMFRTALDRRINAKAGPDAPRGRKDDQRWQNDVYRLSQAVNTPRLIVRERDVPVEYRKRLDHRTTKPGDGCC